MIRNLMLAAGLFTLTAGSAMAATQPHVARTTHHKVAQAGEAPATGDAAKEPKKAKKAHKGKKAKTDAAKAEGGKGEGAAPAPTPAPAPAK